MRMKLSLVCVLLVTLISLPGCDKQQAPQKPEDSSITTKYETVFQAAEGGDIDDVKRHLLKGADINLADEDGFTALHHAVWENHEEVVKLLLAKGANPNTKDSTGETPLHVASGEGHEEIAGMLLDKGADVNAKDECRSTPLHSAVLDKAMVEMLLARGADVNAQDEDGFTPLQWAYLRLCSGSIPVLKQHGGVGEDVRLRLELKGIAYKEVNKAVAEKIKKIVPSTGYRAITWTGFDGDVTMSIAPVKDIQAFAKKIDFGTVTKIDEKERAIEVVIESDGKTK